MSSLGQEIGDGAAEQSHGVAHGQTSAGATVTWRLDCGWRICFQGSSLTRRVSGSGCWWAASVLLHQEVAWASSQHGEWLPPASRESNPKEQGRSCKAFQNLVLEVTHLQLCCISLVTQARHVSVRKGATRGYGYLERNIIGGHPWCWPPHRAC